MHKLSFAHKQITQGTLLLIALFFGGVCIHRQLNLPLDRTKPENGSCQTTLVKFKDIRRVLAIYGAGGLVDWKNASASGFDLYTDRLFTNPCPVMPWFAPAHLPFAIVWKQLGIVTSCRTCPGRSEECQMEADKEHAKLCRRALWGLCECWNMLKRQCFGTSFGTSFTIFELKWFEDRFGSLDSHFGQAWWLHPGCWQCWLQRGCTELKSWWEDRLHVGDSFSSSTLDTFGWSFHYDFQAFWSCDFHQTFAG